MSRWTVWDNREQVSSHSAGIDAHKSCLTTRYASPDTGRRLALYDPTGRIVAVYVDGREQVDELSGSAFQTGPELHVAATAPRVSAEAAGPDVARELGRCDSTNQEGK